MIRSSGAALAALCSALSLGSCHASNAAGAVAMTSLAGGMSAARRANGECYVDCLPGSHCNRGTGLCEPLACSGACGAGFVCEETETGSACVPHDHAAELAARPQERASGAQPYGDGQAVQPPTAAASIGTLTDGGADVPAAALRTPPPRGKDAPASSTSLSPGWMESNPWDPRHADPPPQMSNPNQPPPH